MEKCEINAYLEILRKELIPALGCTEPIAVALATAKAVQVLGCAPDTVEIRCSGNIIKNVKGVVVPNSGGRKGVEIAAALGAVGGLADKELEVLTGINDEHRALADEMVRSGKARCFLQTGVDKLYIAALVTADEHCAEVDIVGKHTRVARIIKDGETVFELAPEMPSADGGSCSDAKSSMTVEKILEFADTVDLCEIEPVFKTQVELNTRISDAGLERSFGAQVGKTLLSSYGDGVKVRARARAAAGSDARMGGCELPVVINSGSGNQGMTVSLPVAEYAKELGSSDEKLYRALAVSNLVSIHLKSYIGDLSAFCGAVSASCGAGAAITYLHGGGLPEVSRTIINTLANVSGIVCDGAKPACAAKIASSLDAAIIAHEMSMKGLAFCPGEGVILDSVEETLKSVGYIARVGMKDTDLEILKVMTGTAEL